VEILPAAGGPAARVDRQVRGVRSTEVARSCASWGLAATEVVAVSHGCGFAAPPKRCGSPTMVGWGRAGGPALSPHQSTAHVRRTGRDHCDGGVPVRRRTGAPGRCDLIGGSSVPPWRRPRTRDPKVPGPRPGGPGRGGPPLSGRPVLRPV